ncbi:hypothetical protein FisN_13Hh166 [Fistulifera solaris]|uniref:SAYSvFN domain-containing protein n=1 Tax=Fistulifera solaris TaxID=1519565 RepID=A0A1Z5KNN8_FISSO|nr:hypothetical protein FisN_13Hh166 [Fistulifera solaris]|eukprot:GAX27735.1 hypothetical protein FisN_13Hh166 [Fistulifera solaris]
MPVWKRSRSLWEKARQEKSLRDYAAAILYELQPVRSTILQRQTLDFRHKVLPQLPSQSRKLAILLMNLTKWIMAFLFRNKIHVFGMLLYYAMVRLIHERLQAGPAVLIVTALIWIFTAGLSDAPREGLSAYAAFNRGFERLMGDIDAEQLLAQHVGGGGFMLLNNQNGNNNHRNENREPRRQRAVERPPAEVPQDDGDAADEPENAMRRRGKKGRKQRRTVEQRRELQLQRQAAREMGFGNGDDQEARLRLLEDQVAEE